MADEKNQFNRYMDDVFKERLRQNEKWGGLEHDDKHSYDDWKKIINEQLRTVLVGESEKERFRRRMIRVIAVAIVALESMDRKSKVSPEPISADGEIDGRR